MTASSAMREAIPEIILKLVFYSNKGFNCSAQYLKVSGFLVQNHFKAGSWGIFPNLGKIPKSQAFKCSGECG